MGWAHRDSAVVVVTERGRILRAFEHEGTPLIRTDFSDDSAWGIVAAQVTVADNFGDGDDYQPNIEVIDDPVFDGTTPPSLVDNLGGSGDPAGYVLLGDARSMAEATAGGEVTVEYVDLSIISEEDAELFHSFRGRAFRCAVGEVASIEANLSIANMDFSDFADNTDSDGVFRGFPRMGTDTAQGYSRRGSSRS